MSYAPGSVTVDRVGPLTWIVELRGEHDMTNADRLRSELADIFTQATTVVVDLTGATFIDSVIVGELLHAQQRVDETPSEHLAIVAPTTGFPVRVLELLQTDGILHVFETRADALLFDVPQNT